MEFVRWADVSLICVGTPTDLDGVPVLSHVREVAGEIGRGLKQLDRYHLVMNLLCADSKLNISAAYLQPGFAFGGSCLPKDVRLLTSHARELATDVPILSSIAFSNDLQIEAARLKIRSLDVQRVAVLGLSFKMHSDDVRESPVIALIQRLIRDGVEVAVYDSDVRLDELIGSNRTYLERELPGIDDILKSSIEDALSDCQSVIITQSHPTFRDAVQRLPKRVPLLDLTAPKALSQRKHDELACET
jgi:GDP-mannose 6-dehydrogenase